MGVASGLRPIIVRHGECVQRVWKNVWFSVDPYHHQNSGHHRFPLKCPDDDDKANHHADRRQARPEAEPFLDDTACARAVAVE
jgi:hypothetical protein